jgi:hypothetical protein
MANLRQDPCKTCGQVHAKCAAHRRDKTPCMGHRIKGAEVCRMHGGSAPQVRAAGERRIQEEKVRRIAATYGAPREVDPNAFVLELIAISAGAVSWMREIIAELDPDALVYGLRQESRQEGRGPEGPVDVTTAVHGMALHGWIEAFHKERTHGLACAATAIKAGLMERQVQVAERRGENTGQWLKVSHEEAGISLTQDEMRRLLAAGVRHLHILEGA